MQIAQLFFQYAKKKPGYPALNINNQFYSYQELAERASQLAKWFTDNKIKFIGIVTSRTLSPYLAILAASWANVAYVPLNLKLPPEKLLKIIIGSEVDAIIVDKNHIANIAETLSTVETIPPFIINPEQSDSFRLPQGLVVLGGRDLGREKLTFPILGRAEDLTYLIFTSGSTGEPKGVPIRLGNLRHYYDAMCPRYSFNADDRFSQCTQLSFDPSVHEILMAWGHGACLFVVPESQLMAPAKFIRDHRLTVWCSVPSVIGFMQQFKMLQPNVFPDIRYSFFGGEALTANYVTWWQTAAPNTLIDNVYGPTECTISCTVYRCLPKEQNNSLQQNIPIGYPNSGLKAAIVDEQQNVVAQGQAGELMISGPQVFSGYWKDAKKTSEKLRVFNLAHHSDSDSVSTVWYRTGDYCIQDASGCLFYLGRIDNQCKIQGFRVELEEIEKFLRIATTCEEVAAVLLPGRAGVGNRLIGLIRASEDKIDKLSIKKYLKTVLPAYMTPEEIVCFNRFPYNMHGKLDRKLLLEWVNEAFEATSRIVETV